MKDHLLTRGVAEIIDNDHLTKRLQKRDTLRVKLGIDPSRPDLHIGHALTLRKLRQFQNEGHTAVLIIGDYTAQIGDPTDRSEARKILSPQEVKQNAEGFLDQAYRILDESKTEVHFQSEWYNAFTLRSIIELMATTTINHLLSHETFAKRISDNLPLHSHEILYPLLQGYDSVMVCADVELGATDQKFNILMGRIVQRAHNQNEQDIMLLKYLPGTDGQAKMSKSLGNVINLNDTPDDMFGKVMSIPDSLLIPYFELATELPQNQVTALAEELKSHTVHPRELKVRLAKQIVSDFYSPTLAAKAAETFDKVFRHKQAPDEIDTLILAPKTYDLVELLVNRTSLVTSKSEARRLIEQRGIKKNQAIVSLGETVSPNDGDEIIIQVGSRRWIKVVWKETL
jgi:tyrosyl-tRNA synthetase